VQGGRDADQLALSLLVGLGPRDGDEQAVGIDAAVGEMERGDLARARCGGAAVQVDGAVANADTRDPESMLATIWAGSARVSVCA
jgi:hypothetical protein